MSATLIAPKPTVVVERPPRAAAPEVVSRFEIETAEMNRWLRMLVPPFFLPTAKHGLESIPCAF